MPTPRRVTRYTGTILTDRARVGILEEKIDKLLEVVADLATSNRALNQQVMELRPLTERENLDRYFKSQMSPEELKTEMARLAKLAEGTDWEAYEKEAHDWR